MSREAMKLALEALKFNQALDKMAENARELGLDYEPAQQEPEYAWPTVADYENDVGFEVNQAFKMGWDMARTTNSFLNQLAGVTPQPAQQSCYCPNCEALGKELAELKAQPAQPQQDVAIARDGLAAIAQIILDSNSEDENQAQREQWAVDKIQTALSEQPAQRTWVGLTDEERDDLLDTYITAEGRARAIEAKLKEKNT